MNSDYEAYPSEHYNGRPYEKCILTKSQVDDFIDRVSSIYIEKYIEKIKIKKRNVKP